MYFYENNLTKDITISLAHEFKNPVSLIKANIELLELEDALNGYQKNVKIIKNELNKISEIVSDFILFCNPHYDADSNINIFYIIKEHIEKFNVYNHITFSLNCFESIDSIKTMGGYSKISIVLSNIYKNCVEAIKSNNGFIQTNIYIKNNHIIIDVIDNGEGINDDIYEKIYEPFFTNKDSGSGLGIPICKNIMKSLNGDFTIFNNNDTGCTTRIIFKKL